MKATDVDVVVVGAGIMGSATARALARAGREVVLVERYQVGHTRGSSHGRARVFRFSYDDPRYVRMAQESLSLWRELEDETGEDILTTTGGLDLGKGEEDRVSALESCGADFELLDAGECRRRFPDVAVPEGGRALFQGDAGVVAADRAWQAFVRSAREAGAELREDTHVERLIMEDDRVEVRAGEERWRARVAVITAGAWTRRLLWGVGEDIPTTPTRETVSFFGIPPAVVPPVVVEWTTPPRYSLFSFDQGLKAAEHHAGPVTDPDQEGEISADSLAQLRDWVRARFPGAEGEPHHAETCIYTNAPDEDFVLERRGPVVIGSACSGHGFKFAPWVGRRLAELAQEATERGSG
ncbi:MAG TPA: N-methyl-L-tryptophan oxidase [Actinomycetota bacterium]|jgi:sarcosine oxidase|nr:N-methyl-L-tryptophan oxidase [Actinomycetota bacterium]